MRAAYSRRDAVKMQPPLMRTKDQEASATSHNCQGLKSTQELNRHLVELIEFSFGKGINVINGGQCDCR